MTHKAVAAAATITPPISLGVKISFSLGLTPLPSNFSCHRGLHKLHGHRPQDLTDSKQNGFQHVFHSFFT